MRSKVAKTSRLKLFTLFSTSDFISTSKIISQSKKLQKDWKTRELSTWLLSRQNIHFFLYFFFPFFLTYSYSICKKRWVTFAVSITMFYIYFNKFYLCQDWFKSNFPNLEDRKNGGEIEVWVIRSYPRKYVLASSFCKIIKIYSNWSLDFLKLMY